MLKPSFKILVLFVSLFVVATNIGYSVVALDVRQSVEVNNSCCSDKAVVNSCCEVKVNACESKKPSTCCCSQSHQVVQFSFNAPIDEELKEFVLQPLISNSPFKQAIYNQLSIFIVDSQIFPPPKLGVRLSFLQTYRI
jgi:hypothetical protein